jgi:hypothetical protein
VKGGVLDMKVFASRFLESPSNDTLNKDEKWTWEPHSEEVCEIYASGAATSTQASTYAAEKDNRSDSDRPNEGMLVA